MNSENRERETLMLIKCLRAARESLKESDMWGKWFGKDDYDVQRNRISESTMKAAANAEIALMEAYKLMTMMVSDEADKKWIEAYGE